MPSRTHRIAPLAGLLTAAAIGLSTSPAAAASPLRVEGRHFKDPAGRAVLLRGVNVAGDSKVPPFTPASDPAVFDPLAGWGMNVVRLLFTWEAYEPQKGAYDTAYLDYYAAAAKAAGERGLYVIVDLHQDAFSRYSVDGCGEGFPAWALPDTVTPEVPDNGPACAKWGIKMQTDQDMMTSWQAFFDDVGGVKSRYFAMLESVSSRLAEAPGVIGYDIMNEPWGDEATQLSPFYEAAAAALRKAHPDAVLFISPRALTSAGTQTELPKPAFGNIAYSPHFYDASVVLLGSWNGAEPEIPFKNMNDKAAEWGVPLFLGEFGAPGPAEDGDLYVDTLYRRLDAGFTSGAHWVYTPGWTDGAKDGWNTEDFSIVDDKGALRKNYRVRPAPRAVSGEPTTFHITDAADPSERSVELTWDNDPKTGETELFLSPQTFFGADLVAVETTGEGLSCTVTGDLVHCASPEPGPMSITVKKGVPQPDPEPAEANHCGLTGLELWLLLLPVGLRRRRRPPSLRSAR